MQCRLTAHEAWDKAAGIKKTLRVFERIARNNAGRVHGAALEGYIQIYHIEGFTLQHSFWGVGSFVRGQG